MARSKVNLPNIDNSSPDVYLQGRIKDNTGAGDGTPVNEFVYGDMHQTWAKLMSLYGITYNNLPDNETNGYQFIESLIALASKNDYILSLTSSEGVLRIPIKIGKLKPNESFICKAEVDRTDETSVKGTLDNTTKAAIFTGDFKIGERVLVVNTDSNVQFFRLVDHGNFDVVASFFNYLKKATQTQENTGTSDAVSTTPLTNKNVFARRVNGLESPNYLATEAQNGLLSKEDKLILNNIGADWVRNIGAFAGLDPNNHSVGDVLTPSGNVVSAVVTSDTSNATTVEVTFANAMENTNYKLHLSVQSQGNMDLDNNIQPLVWKAISTTKASILVEETSSVTQNLKIHIDVIQL